MPIVKCKASKATPMKGLAYIMDPKKTLASGSIGFRSTDPKQMGKQMMDTMLLHGKGADKEERKYYHVKTSFALEDLTENGGTLTPEKANDYAMNFAEKMWPGREVAWSVQQHGEAMHIHFIVAACAASTGKKLDARQSEYRRWKDYAQDLAAVMGLTPLDWRKATRRKRLRESQAEMPVKETFAEKGLQERGKTVWKDELRSIIDQAAGSCRSMDEFRAYLQSQGVTLTRCTDTTISYKLGERKACRGDTLGGDYTAQAIQDALQHNRLEPAPEQGKEHAGINALIGHAQTRHDVATAGGRTLSKEERENARQLGRLAGVKRSEVDAMIDDAAKASWAEKQQAWADYKAASNEFWAEYNVRQEALKKELNTAYKRKQRIRNAEWELDGRNRYRSLIGAVFAYIYLEHAGTTTSAKAEIARLKDEQQKLRTAAALFKSNKRDAIETLREKGLSLDAYATAVQRMQAQADQLAAANGLLTPADRKKLEKAAEKTKEQRRKRWEREGR